MQEEIEDKAEEIIDEVEQSAEEMVPKETLLRTMADFDNFRKRSIAQNKNVSKIERRNILFEMLDVLDSLDVAVVYQMEGEFLEGIFAIRQKMLDTFKRFGVEPFESKDQKFDPNKHEAIATLPSKEAEENMVLEVLQSGYAFADGEILRAAKVAVSCRLEEKEN